MTNFPSLISKDVPPGAHHSQEAPKRQHLLPGRSGSKCSIRLPENTSLLRDELRFREDSLRPELTELPQPLNSITSGR